jgi:hypothetical protein
MAKKLILDAQVVEINDKVRILGTLSGCLDAVD